MTVSTSTRKQTFSGGQSSLTFSFRTLVSNPEYIKVKTVVVATGVEANLTYNTDYTVSVNSNGVGGTVTVSPTFSTAYNYVVYRDTSEVQESDYDDYNQFPANTLENDLDRLTMILQEVTEDVSRVITFPISSSVSSSTVVFPSPEANKLIGWNSGATALENKTAVSLGTATQASTADAQAATNNTNFMTPYLVKLEVENPGAVLIPAANVSTGATTSITVTNGTITNLTVSTLSVGTPTTGTILIYNGTSFAANNGLQGTAGQALLSNGPGVAPSYGTITATAGTQVFTSSGTFTAPTGITRVYVTMVGGGGGGGGGGNPNGGGGGGSGAYILHMPYAVTAGSNYAVTISTGGTGGTPTNNGGSGGTTYFATLSVLGGTGGFANGSGGTAGLGIAGTGSAPTGGGQPTTSGFTGGAKSGATGGGGAGSIFGVGASGSTGGAGTGSNADANTGTGGGGGNELGASNSGGNGASGMVIIRY